MTIGIKYCGGCNPLFNREYYVKALKKQLPNYEYRLLSDGKESDIWVVVCGCMRACAYTEDLIANERIIVIDTVDKFDEVRDYLTSLLDV